jgi:hypothetical protein
MRADSTKAYAPTVKAISGLLAARWLVTSHAITVILSAAAVELLELAPEGEAQESVDDPDAEGDA